MLARVTNYTVDVGKAGVTLVVNSHYRNDNMAAHPTSLVTKVHNACWVAQCCVRTTVAILEGVVA